MGRPYAFLFWHGWVGLENVRDRMEEQVVSWVLCCTFPCRIKESVMHISGWITLAILGVFFCLTFICGWECDYIVPSWLTAAFAVSAVGYFMGRGAMVIKTFLFG